MHLVQTAAFGEILAANDSVGI